jgi:ankyrin repeat protein
MSAVAFHPRTPSEASGMNLLSATEARDHALIAKFANLDTCAYTSRTPQTKGSTALHIAARLANPKALALLLPHSDPNAQDQQGRSPMNAMGSMFHTWSGPWSDTAACCRLLLAAGADPHARDIEKMSDLHRLCMAGQTEAALALIDAGAKMSVESQGWTPLMASAYSGKLDLIEAIFRLTPKPLATKATYPYEGYDSIGIALMFEHVDAAELIESLLDQKALAKTIPRAKAAAKKNRI